MILIWIKIQYACKTDDFQQPLWPSQSRLSRRFILCYKLVYANTYETKNSSCYASLFQASTRPSHCLTYTDTSFSSPKTWLWSFCFLEHQSLPETNVKKLFQFLLSYWYLPLQEVLVFIFLIFFGDPNTQSHLSLINNKGSFSKKWQKNLHSPTFFSFIRVRGRDPWEFTQRKGRRMEFSQWTWRLKIHIKKGPSYGILAEHLPTRMRW